MFTAAAMIAEQVAGKATRDALFLSSFHVTRWPAMLVASALVSIAVVLLTARSMSMLSPARMVPAAFGSSAVLLLGVWGLSLVDPGAAAVALHLHVAVAGPVLISGFWSLFNERFDPHTARRQIGAIGSVGTLGGLGGGLAAIQVASLSSVAAMLPVLAGFHLFCALATRSMAGTPARSGVEAEPPASSGEMLEGLRILSRTHYLRQLALLVLLGTVSAALLDYVFRVYATERFSAGSDLMRVFSWFYVAVALLAFVVQTTLSRISLDQMRAARTAATLPAVVAGGSIVVMLAPGPASAAIARGVEMVMRNSLFRSGYELLYTPVAAAEKRSTKAIVDVGFERLGDALGGGVIGLVLLAGVGAPALVLLTLTLGLSLAGLVIAHRLHHGYVATLASRLAGGAVRLDAGAPIDLSQTLDSRILPGALRGLVQEAASRGSSGSSGSGEWTLPWSSADPVRSASAGPPRELERFMERLAELRSDDVHRIRGALAGERLTPELVPHVVPLLAREDVARDALRALREVAPSVEGQLVDALLDARRDLAVRRQIPRVLSVCDSERAVQGLFAGLEDQRFEVRTSCGRALSRIQERNPDFDFGARRVEDAVLREVAVEARVWESQRQIHGLAEEGDSPFVARYLRGRANASLEHVFTLMSLGLAPRPLLRIAFHDLHGRDAGRRGLALEYLECVLPSAVRARLWPFLEEHGPGGKPPRPREEIIKDLVESHESIGIRIAELRKMLGEG